MSSFNHLCAEEKRQLLCDFRIRVRVNSSRGYPVTLLDWPFPAQPETSDEVRRLPRKAHVECSSQVDRADPNNDAWSGLDAYGFASHLLCKELEAGTKMAPLVLGEGTGPPAVLSFCRASIVEPPAFRWRRRGFFPNVARS